MHPLQVVGAGTNPNGRILKQHDDWELKFLHLWRGSGFAAANDQDKKE